MVPKSPPIHRTPLYRAKAAYANMRRRCAGGNATETSYASVELRMTLDEWLTWAVPRYASFIEARPSLTPCAARMGDCGHYEIGNIAIISTIENREQMAMPLLLRPDGTKMCAACRQIKPAAEFCKKRARRDGLHDTCRGCNTARRHAYRLRRNTGL
jgi:RNase P subunit RPR2